MKILLVYPGYPDTFWSFKHVLKLIAKKASFPPLGLLTVAALLPGEWQKKLVDMNVNALTDKDIRWADYVFVGAMSVQRQSARAVIARCKELGAKVVAGGPLFTSEYEAFDEVDHLVLGEGEVTVPLFLKDLENGSARHIYLSEEKPDIAATPIPVWSLVNMKKYSSMSMQYSRGCPFNCEFCEIIVLNGRKVRTKGKAQVLAELEAIYNAGWRTGVFIVDDNFIGNKQKLKAEILPAIIEWRQKRKLPFVLSTEVSINLADDEELMRLMTEAGFNTVFVGIETPNEDSLVECHKYQNQKRDLVSSVKRIQQFGMEVQGGFIVGFDSDKPSIFKSQISFIQNSGIVTAMVGLLNAPPGTQLYKRLAKENRLLRSFSGNNTDCSMNFIPKMNYEALVKGYRQIMETIYSPKCFYERIRTFLKEYQPQAKVATRMQLQHVKGFFSSIWFVGIIGKGKRYYWRLFVSTLLRYPRKFPLYMMLAGYGYHFRKVVERNVAVPVDIPVDISEELL